MLFFRNWTPPGPVKAVIDFVHGFGEHSGRFAFWALKFNSVGIAFTAIDYRGHGKAGGKRGHAESFRRLMDDIEALAEQSRNIYPSLPHFLYGHSMGGNLVINYHIRRERNFFKGLIVTSPWLKLAIEAPILTVILGRILVTVFPRVVTKTNLVVEHISHDPIVQREYKNDSLVHGYISLKLYNVISKAGIFVLRNFKRIHIPMLLMHGTADQITSYKASIYLGYKTRELTTFKSWPGLYHELHNEYEKEEVFQYILTWINNNV